MTTTSDPPPISMATRLWWPARLRAPWKWESLLVESAVIGGSDRWTRRLNGLAAEYDLKIRELTSEQPDSPRIPRLERERQNLAHLRAFALPLIEEMSAWPKQATWGDWIQRLEEFAPQVLRRPEFVLRVLADLRPMAAVGPVSLTEVRDVLADRLAALEVEPPAHRYGRVLVCSPDQVRGRAVPRWIRAGTGRATVSAKAARGSAAVGRSPARDRRRANPARRSR